MFENGHGQKKLNYFEIYGLDRPTKTTRERKPFLKTVKLAP